MITLSVIHTLVHKIMYVLHTSAQQFTFFDRKFNLRYLLRLILNFILPVLITTKPAFGNNSDQEIITQIINAITVKDVINILNQLQNINQPLDNQSVLKYVAENHKLQSNYSSGFDPKQSVARMLNRSPKDPYSTLVEYFLSKGGQFNQIQTDLVSEALVHNRIAMAEVLIENGFNYSQKTILLAIEKGVNELTVRKMIQSMGLPSPETLYNKGIPGIAAQNGYGKLVKEWIESEIIDNNKSLPAKDGYSDMKIIDYALKADKIESNLSLIENLIEHGADLNGRYKYQAHGTMGPRDSASLVERIFQLDNGKIGIQIIDAAITYQSYDLRSHSSKGGYSAYYLINNPSWVPELIAKGLKIDIYELLAILTKMRYKDSSDGKWYKSANYVSWLNVVKRAFDQNNELLFNASKRAQILEMSYHLKCVEVVDHIVQISRPQSKTEVIKNFEAFAKEEKSTSSKFTRLETLIQFSSSEDLKETINGKTGLHLLAEISTSIWFDVPNEKAHFEAIAKKLLDKGIDINAVDNEGKTALDYAIIYKNKKLIHFFLNQHATVSFQSLDLALDILERNTQNEIEELFKQVSTIKPEFEKIYSLIIKANSLERPDLIIELLKKFPNLIQYRKSGFSPLAFYIAELYKPKINFVEPLLKYVLAQESAETIYTNEKSQLVRLSEKIKNTPALSNLTSDLSRIISYKETLAQIQETKHQSQWAASKIQASRKQGGIMSCHMLFH